MKRFLLWCLATVVLGAPFAVLAQGRSPAIAVAANGSTASASVGAQLGRSPFFLLFDAKGSFLSAESNPYKDSGNAGIPAVNLLAGKGVKIVVAEGFGGQIVQVMSGKSVRPMEFKGIAQEAAKKAAQLK